MNIPARLSKITAVSLALCTLAPPAWECSCARMTRQQAIAATPIVFEGRVLRVRKDGARIYADVETSRILKGSVPRIVEVGTAESSAACGYTFRTGQQLTVGATLDQLQFSTTSCTMGPLNPGRN